MTREKAKQIENQVYTDTSPAREGVFKFEFDQRVDEIFDYFEYKKCPHCEYFEPASGGRVTENYCSKLKCSSSFIGYGHGCTLWKKQ